MEGYLNSNLWCQLDSLRFIVERNPGSVVILVSIVGFLFWRLQAILVDFYLWLVNHTRIGAWAKQEMGTCKKKPEGKERDNCFGEVIEELENRIDWFFKLLLNLVALALLMLGLTMVYLVFHPPVSCAASDNSGIYVPAVFKVLYSKGGEVLYVDETTRSYVRIWAGKDANYPEPDPTTNDLQKKYEIKVAEALKYMAGKSLETDARPTTGRDYFVVSWRDRDNFDVYFVSRLVSGGDGKTHIDSLEISSPVHGNALVSLDYRLLFCSFVKPSASDLPQECQRGRD